MHGVNQRAMLAALFAFLYAPFLWFHGVIAHRKHHIDLPSFWAAAHAAFEAKMSPYAPETVRAFHVGEVNPFLYPPPSLLLFFPMSLASYEEVKLLTLVGNHLALLALAFVGVKVMLAVKATELVIAVVLAYMLAFFPIAETMTHGQTNIVIALSLAVFWVGVRLNYSIAAAVAMTVAILLKAHLAAILVVPLLLRRFNVVLMTAGIVGAAALLSWVILPPLVWQDWLSSVAPNGGYGQSPDGLFSPAAIWNQSFNGHFSRLFTPSIWAHPIVEDPELGRRLTYVASAVTVAVSVVCLAVLRRKVGPREALDRGLAIVIPLTYLVAPFSWEHHLTYLLPVIAFQVVTLASLDRHAAPVQFALVAAAAILIAAPFGVGAKIYGVLTLWGVAVVEGFWPEPSTGENQAGFGFSGNSNPA